MLTKSPLCYTHRDRNEPPRLCMTCQRMAVEHDIVTRVVDALLAAEYVVFVEGESTKEATREQTLALLFDLDDAYLSVQQRSGASEGWIRFVFGNDGWDVVSDYTTNLENVLKPVNDYADTFA